MTKKKPDPFAEAVKELLIKVERTKGSTRCTCQDVFICTRCQLHSAAEYVQLFFSDNYVSSDSSKGTK